jgi:hypothetical protein
MNRQSSRLIRERRTIEVMVAMYCHKHHEGKTLCPECQALLEYAQKRLEKCPFQEGKTTCAKCPVHCYKKELRARVRTIMRYSGPRMIYLHPVLAVRHLIDSRCQEPIPAKNTPNTHLE